MGKVGVVDEDKSVHLIQIKITNKVLIMESVLISDEGKK